MPSDARDKQKFGAPTALPFQTNCLAVATNDSLDSTEHEHQTARSPSIYRHPITFKYELHFSGIREIHAFRFLALTRQVRRFELAPKDEDTRQAG
jgi:hypothetical protein